MEMKIDALAGTLESSDVMVRIGPAAQPGIQLEIDSIVKQQFGAAIEQVVRETLAQLGVKQANVVVDDKGALECVLRARVQAAALRAQAVAPDGLIEAGYLPEYRFVQAVQWHPEHRWQTAESQSILRAFVESCRG